MWRSPVAHTPGGRGAAGSNPVIPTTIEGQLASASWPFVFEWVFLALQQPFFKLPTLAPGRRKPPSTIFWQPVYGRSAFPIAYCLPADYKLYIPPNKTTLPEHVHILCPCFALVRVLIFGSPAAGAACCFAFSLADRPIHTISPLSTISAMIEDELC